MAEPLPASLIAAPPRRWSWKRFSGKFLIISILLHVLFGAGATVWVVQEIRARGKVTFQAGSKSPNPSTRAIEHKVQMQKKKSSMSAPAQAKRITSTGVSKVTLPEMTVMANATTLTANTMGGAGGTGLQGFGTGGGMGGGAGGGGSGINFFGLKTRAKNVVFVTDISGSMIMGKKNAQTYKILEDEVTKAINGLDAQTKFNIVAFSKEADPFHEQPMTATTSDKQNALSWFRGMNPMHALKADSDPHKAFQKYKDGRHAGTRADLGLKRAFAMKPDVIIFVSDGEPNEPGKKGSEVVKDILESIPGMQKNLPQPAKINAVAYMADNGQAFMRKLAEQNGGTFKEITDAPKP